MPRKKKADAKPLRIRAFKARTSIILTKELLEAARVKAGREGLTRTAWIEQTLRKAAGLPEYRDPAFAEFETASVFE